MLVNYAAIADNICKEFLMKWGNAQENMSYEEHWIQNYTFGQFCKTSVHRKRWEENCEYSLSSFKHMKPLSLGLDDRLSIRVSCSWLF